MSRLKKGSQVGENLWDTLLLILDEKRLVYNEWAAGAGLNIRLNDAPSKRAKL